MIKVVLSTPPFISDFRSLFFTMEDKYKLDIEVSVAKNDESIKTADLIVFSGGEDISPQLYGEQNVSSYTNPYRDYYDVLNFECARDYEKKILGVCRGHQLVNALMGGKLIQHIREPHPAKHELTFSEDAKYKFPFVNSMHHQGVKILGKSMISKAMYNDVHEITESKDGKILSVQFHPEFMYSPHHNLLEMIKDFMCGTVDSR